jgi:maleate cis-trans isomerase
MAPLSKINVARHQLGTALELFIRDRDPIAVHCLACAGCEIIETIAEIEGVPPFSSHILKTFPDMDMRALRDKQRIIYNARLSI